MFQFAGHEEISILIGVFLSVLILLSFTFFKSAFDLYVKFRIVREKFHSKEVQRVVDHVYPRHMDLKRQAIKSLFYGFVLLVASMIILFLSTLK
ncbi:hypothetical protein ACSZN3_21395 [Aeromonas hydrophila]|uniref:hypothetical protein n=1 Tax=Aeromonas hydrophila TaxID=644 RepID=UPI003EC6F64F